MTSRILSAAAIILFAATAQAQVTHVSTSPGASEVFGDLWHGRPAIDVLCAGVDANFDGRFDADSGDVAPRWVVLDYPTGAKLDSMSFDGLFDGYPLRYGVDGVRRRLYVAQLGRIRSFDLDSLTLVDDSLALGAYNSVSLIQSYRDSSDDPVPLLVAHMRPSDGGTGHIVTIDPTSGDTLDVVAAGINPQMSITPTRRTPNIDLELYTLDEGEFGQPNSTISYFVRQGHFFRNANSEELGVNANHLLAHGERLYVACTASNAVRVLDARTGVEVPPSPIAVGSDPTRGPNTLAMQGDSVLIVGTAGGQIRRYRTDDGSLIDSIPMPDRVAALCVRDSTLYVGVDVGLDDFRLDSRMAVVDLNSGTVIDTIELGVVPASIFVDTRGDVNVIGRDSAMTHRFRSIVDHATNAISTFPLFDTLTGLSGSIASVAYDSDVDSLYVTENNGIWAFSGADPAAAPTLSYIDSNISGQLVGVTLDGDYLLAVEVSMQWRTENGHLLVIRRSDKRRMARALVGTLPVEAVQVPGHRDNVLAFMTLNRRDLDTDRSTLSYMAMQPNVFGDDTLGSGANHVLAIEDDALVVTLNGSHQIAVVPQDQWDTVYRIPVGTSGYDGPRECFYNDDVFRGVVVTTYAGDVRLIGGRDSAEIVGTIEVGGRAEGIIGGNDGTTSRLFVATPFQTDQFYSPSDQVAIIDLTTLHVERNADARAAGVVLDRNEPNPASTFTRAKFSIDHPCDIRLSVVSLLGTTVATVADEHLAAGTYSLRIPLDHLIAGTYLLRLEAEGVSRTRGLKVVR